MHPNAIQAPSAPGGSGKVAASKLPLDIYESVVDIAGGKSETKFVKIAPEAGGYKVETYEAERIAVETASRITVSDAAANASTSQSSKGTQETPESTCKLRESSFLGFHVIQVAYFHPAVVAGLTTQRNAISMLHSRVGTILEYLEGVRKGKVAPDHETLRQISSLVSSISSNSSTVPVIAAASSASSAFTAETASGSLVSEIQQEQTDVMLMSLLGSMTKILDEMNMLVDKFGIAHAREPGRGDDELFGMVNQGRHKAGGGHRKGLGDGARRHSRREGFF